MIYTIKNNDLQVQINSFGAVIMSILKNGEEFLWQGDEKYWSGRAPILFPIVGKVKDDTIFINNQECRLSKHGFVRDNEWEVVQISETEIECKIIYNDEFLEKYPYKFELIAKFWLENNKFKQKYIVKNLDNKKMCYGFGLHPAFFCNKSPDEKFEDYVIDFNKKIDFNACSFTDEMQVNCNDTIEIMKNENILQLEEKLFVPDAIITTDIKFDKVSIVNKNKGKVLDFEFSGFDIFAIWKTKDAPFVCFEPWTTISGKYPYEKNYEKNDTTNFLEIGEQKEFFAIVTI